MKRLTTNISSGPLIGLQDTKYRFKTVQPHKAMCGLHGALAHNDAHISRFVDCMTYV